MEESHTNPCMDKQYYVYILRSLSARFYVGVTNDLVKRVWQHKQKLVDSFTAKYNIDMLIYFEVYHDPASAIAREKQLKNWNRKKKIELISKVNLTFKEIPLESLI